MEAYRGPEGGLDGEIGELWLFVRATGKWWLIPVLFALLVLGLAIWLSASAYAPFIYSLF